MVLQIFRTLTNLLFQISYAACKKHKMCLTEPKNAALMFGTYLSTLPIICFQLQGMGNGLIQTNGLID